MFVSLVKKYLSGSEKIGRGRVGKSTVVLALALLLVLSVPAVNVLAQAPPPLPAIYEGTVVDTNGQPIAAGTVKAYIEDELKGQKDFTNGAYQGLLVQGDAQSTNKPVTFKVWVGGTDNDAASSPDPVLWRSGRISGLDFPMVNLTIPVQEPNLVVLTVEPTLVQLIKGQTRQLNVTRNPSGTQLSYSSSNPAVASVSGGGLVTAVNEGSAIITVTGTFSGYLDGVVTAQVLVSLPPPPPGGGGAPPPATSYTLTMKVEGTGTVTPAAGTHSYPINTPVSVLAFPAEGWEFVRWDGPANNPTSRTTSVTMNNNIQLTAVFQQIGAPTPPPPPAPGPTVPPAPVGEKVIVLTLDSKVALVNNVEFMMDVAPFIKPQVFRTMVPVRFVSEYLGAKVDWLPATRQVRITQSNREIMLTLGSDKALVNGQEVTIDSPAELLSQRTFVPLRFVSEMLGANVGWDGKTRAITIRM